MLNGLVLIVWISLVGGDPLLDPWGSGEPRMEAAELTTFYEPVEGEAWRLEDSDLLNPFEPEEVYGTLL